MREILNFTSGSRPNVQIHAAIEKVETHAPHAMRLAIFNISLRFVLFVLTNTLVDFNASYTD